MSNELTTTDMNIEDYEDQAIKKSKLAKGIGIAAAGAVGGAAIAAGTTYAATVEDTVLDEPLNAEELINGAEIGEEIEPITEPAPQPTTQYVYVEKEVPEPEPEKTTDVTWDETTNYYVNGERILSVEEGSIDGRDVMLIDEGADGVADYLAYDVNNNHVYEENEVIKLTPMDNIHMGNPTAHTTDNHYEAAFFGEEKPEDYYADYVPEPHHIHNNFEDEKTGEEYYGDFAENNPDYNPNADMDYGNSNHYLAENYEYDGEDSGYYQAGLDESAVEDNVAYQPDIADASEIDEDSFDSMINTEEFLG